MATAVDKIKIALNITDSGATEVVKKLESSFRGLANAANQLDSQGIGKVATRIKSFDNAGRRNIETIKGQINAMQGLRSQAQIGSRQFRALTADINRYSKELAKAEGLKRGGGAGGRLKTAGGVAATALGAGVFGGPEGFAGSLIGGAIGGVPGAVVGATAGAFVGNMRKQAAAVAETVAKFNKYQIALAGVSTDQKDFNTSIDAAKKFSEQFVVPLDKTIEQYTKLKASVVGAGLGTEETNKAFEALSASVLATGGSSEDLNSALRAASQVFSKGKVSAEELRQQIGERLPGAFTIFADSMGISTKQLDKLLEGGKVTLDDFVGFTEELIRRYGTTAEVLAQAPELAGARLEVAVTKAQLAFGGFFANVGAGFQDYATNLINFALNNEKSIKENIAKFIVFGEDIVTIFKSIGNVIVEAMGPVFRFIGDQLQEFARMAGKLAEDINTATLEEKYIQTYGRESYEALKQSAADKARTRLGTKLPESIGSMQPLLDAVTSEDLQNTAREIREDMLRSALPSSGGQLSYADRVANAVAGLNLKTPTNFGSGLRSGDFDGSGIDPSGTSADKRAAASERLVSLTGQLAGKVGEVGERELITLKYMIARQKILDNNLLPGTDKQVDLNEALAGFRKQIAALDEKEANAMEKALGAKVKFEQLEANIFAKKMGLTSEQVKEQLLQANINSLTERFKDLLIEAGVPAEEIQRRIKGVAQAMVDLKDKTKSFKDQFADGMKSMGDITTNLANFAVDAFSSMGDKLAEFVTTGKANFKDFARSLLADLSRIFVRFAIFQTLKGFGLFADGGVVGASASAPDPLTQPGVMLAANGAVMARNKIVPYAKGGIVKKPTFFQYANGGSGRFGLMGEAGPEAIMPLRRGRNGKLGVESSGSVGNVVVNVDASGSNVQGDQPNAKALGSAIGAAVQAELIKQKRPGGLLS